MSMDDNMIKQASLDVARVLIRTKCCYILNETFNVDINGSIFSIKTVEDFHGPIRYTVPYNLQKEDNSFESREDDQWEPEEINFSND